MKLYRIGDLALPIFDGGGALRHSGRWHSAGRRIIYSGPNVSCCRLELMANLGRAVLRKSYGVVEIAVPDNVSVTTIAISDLPPGWDHPRDHTVSRPIGDAWYDSRWTLLLRVPSVASPNEFTVLVNQEHSEFGRLVASQPEPTVWDERTFG
jgi:RES domain-containing protein